MNSSKTDFDYTIITHANLNSLTTLPLISVNNISVIEGINPLANFLVTLSTPTDTNVTVDYATDPGTATAELDYTPTTGTLTFAPGETSKTLPVSILNDNNIEESLETFTLNLSNALGGTIENAASTATITDDDVLININRNVSIREGRDSLANFTVTLAAPVNYAVTVDYATDPGTATAELDYTPTTGTLTFAPGETSKTLPVSILNDNNIEESLETFTLNLSNALGGTIENAVSTATITDDDVLININRTVSVVEGRDSLANFTVTLAEPVNYELTVDYATDPGTATAELDYTPTTGTLTFAPGETSKTLPVSILNDNNIEESLETFTLNLSNALGGTIENAVSNATITDDDVLININRTVSIREGRDSLANFTVTLAEPVNYELTVDYATDPGTATAELDYTPTTGTLTFAPGETSKTLPVSILNDNNIEESLETFTLNLSNALGGTIENAVSNATITDDDVLININRTVSIREGRDSLANFTVTLAAPVNYAVTVDYATDPGTATAELDYTPTTGTLTFAPGETSKTLPVSILNDNNIEESLETFTLNLSNALGGTIENAVSNATITDDDVLININRNVSVVERRDSFANFTVTLASPVNYAVTVNYATNPGIATANLGYTPTTGTLTFAPGETTKTIPVRILDNNIIQSNRQTFTLNLSNPLGGTIGNGESTATITDDDDYSRPGQTRSYNDIPLTSSQRIPLQVNTPNHDKAFDLARWNSYVQRGIRVFGVGAGVRASTSGRIGFQSTLRTSLGEWWIDESPLNFSVEAPRGVIPGLPVTIYTTPSLNTEFFDDRLTTLPSASYSLNGIFNFDADAEAYLGSRTAQFFGFGLYENEPLIRLNPRVSRPDRRSSGNVLSLRADTSLWSGSLIDLDSIFRYATGIPLSGSRSLDFRIWPFSRIGLSASYTLFNAGIRGDLSWRHNVDLLVDDITGQLVLEDGTRHNFRLGQRQPLTFTVPDNVDFGDSFDLTVSNLRVEARMRNRGALDYDIYASMQAFEASASISPGGSVGFGPLIDIRSRNLIDDSIPLYNRDTSFTIPVNRSFTIPIPIADIPEVIS